MKRIITCFLFSCTFPVWGELLPREIVRNTSSEIDNFVANYLKKKNITANPIIDDATFVRRCYVNISGRIPTVDEAKSFIQDNSADKRGQLIDYLILSNGHKSQMFNFWADLLRIQTNKRKHGLGWHVWVRDAVDKNMPYDQFVNTMLSASGSAVDNPAVGYYLRDQGMLLDNVSNSVQIFLGNRIGCAQCHDHPTEDMTQKQYYELAAFTSSNTFRNKRADQLIKKALAAELNLKPTKLDTKQKFNKYKKSLPEKEQKEFNDHYREYGYLFRGIGIDKIAVPEDPEKILKIPHDYQYNDAKPGDEVKPKVFFGNKIKTTHSESHKKSFADWVTSTENPYFTKVIVNRLWAEAFGKGIVEPLDDWSETTTVANPELLDYLTRIMVATKYDVREFMRVLYNTRLFESSVAIVEDNMGDSCDFKGPVLRRMKAEEFHDSLLTIQHGNQDSAINHKLKSKWQTYTESIHNLREMPLDNIAKLKDHSAAKRSLKQDVNNYRGLLKKAEKEGNQAKIKEYKQKLAKAKKEQKNYSDKGNSEMSMMMSYNNNIKSSNSARASEKPTPHRPESFLIQFGASDRQTPEAAHTSANIPQALTLLNSREIEKLTKSQSTLMQNVLNESDPSKRLNALFLGIYGTFPNDTERAKFEPLVSDNSQLKKLAHAMITSKRFLFIQ